MEKAEVLIVGAGLIGSSAAWHLARLGVSGITVIDFDLEGTLSSSELNAGGVRATFSQPINILASKLSIDFFSKHAEELGYRACGYLWLVSKAAEEGFSKAVKTQTGLGWDVQVWDLDHLRRQVPFLDKLDDVTSAHFAPRDGLINPNLLKNFYRARARENGVRFIDRSQLVAAEFQAVSNSWNLKIRRFPKVISTSLKEEVLTSVPALGIEGRGALGVIENFSTVKVLNAAGAWSGQVAKILGYPCRTVPVKRQVCVFDSRDVDLSPYGMMVDTSGVYFHPEASNGMAGIALPTDPSGFSFEYSGEAFFHDVIWPKLYERSTGFEKLKHLTGWSGLYENSLDHSAIIGPVLSNSFGPNSVFDCHSFSGHGAMHSYAVGLGIAERIVHGKYQTLDFSVLNGNRFDLGKLVPEGSVI